MLLADLAQGRIISDKEIKAGLYGRNPYQLWIPRKTRSRSRDLPEPPRQHGADQSAILKLQRAFGYTDEDDAVDSRP